jgi:hypothetical protein
MVGTDIEPLSIGDPPIMPDFNPSASEDALALANEISPEPGNDRRSLWFSVCAVEYIIVGQCYIEDILVRCVCNPVRIPGALQVPRIAAVWELADPKYRRPDLVVPWVAAAKSALSDRLCQCIPACGIILGVQATG